MTYISKVMDNKYDLSIPRIGIAAGITGAIYWLYLASIVRFVAAPPFGNLIMHMKGSDFVDLMFDFIFTTEGIIHTSIFIVINCTMFGLLFSLINNLISQKR